MKLFRLLTWSLVFVCLCTVVCASDGVSIQEITDDPQKDELYALADEIAEWMNEVFDVENAFSAEDINYDDALLTYVRLPAAVAAHDGDLEAAAAECDYYWSFFAEYEGELAAVRVSKGKGITENSPLYDVLTGKREGTDDELAEIERTELEKGHYRISVAYKWPNTFYQDSIAEAAGRDCDMYFSSADVQCNAVIIYENGEILIRHSNPDALKNESVDISNIGTNYVGFDEVVDYYEEQNEPIEKVYDEHGDPIDIGIGSEIDEKPSNKTAVIAAGAMAVLIVAVFALVTLNKKRKA